VRERREWVKRKLQGLYLVFNATVVAAAVTTTMQDNNNGSDDSALIPERFTI